MELRHALTMLDQDHDHLVAQADVKDESIADLTQQLQAKGECLAETEAKVVQLQMELQKAREIEGNRIKEVTKVQGECFATKTELQAEKEQLNMLTQQIRELRDDLNTMTQVGLI